LKESVEMRTPVYQQIKSTISEEIKNGKYKPGEILPSVNQLAVMFSTSRNTAVKAVSDLAMEGIIHCVQGKGSVVNELGEKTRTGRTGKKSQSLISDIGILLSDFDDINHPYLAKILRGISLKAKTTPCHLKTFCVNNYSIENLMKTESFDGLIILTELPMNSVLLLKQNQVKFVLVNNDVYGEDISCVSVDSFTATYEAIKYLHSLGHEKISVLTGPCDARSTAISHAAYQKAMKDIGLDVDERLFRASPEWGEAGGYYIFKELLNSGKRPTAVFALEDYIAIGAMRAAEEVSLQIPRDLSIIGTGDMLTSSNVRIPLTTFDNKLGELGIVALEMICSQLKKETVQNSKICLVPELLVRASCAPLRP